MSVCLGTPATRRSHSWSLAPTGFLWSWLCVCVCRLVRAFIDFPEKTSFPYFIGVATFFDVMAETKFEPRVPIDKLIIYQVPKFNSAVWRKLHVLKIWDVLTFVDGAPNYHLPNPSPPPFFLIPPSQQLPPTRRQLFPTTQEIPAFYMRWPSKNVITFLPSYCTDC